MAATEASPPPRVDEVLAHERRLRRPVGIMAIVAGLLAIVSGVAPQAIYNNYPHVLLGEALRDAAGESIGRAGLKTEQILFYNDKALPLLLIAVCQAITAIGLGYLLIYLFNASRARGATTMRAAKIFVWVGATATALGALLLQAGVMVRANDFASSSDQSTEAAHDVLRSGVVVFGSGIGGVGNLALAAGCVMVALGAMRVGLLTRFLGVLGAIVGALLVLGPLTGSPSFIIQAFWLLATGALVLGRLPRGLPPAWNSGEAMPWPSNQELREARERARDEGGGAVTDPRDEPRPDAPSAATSAKKKRKRRG